MIFSSDISSTTVIEAELVRLKALYVKALETKNLSTVGTLRKTIKSLRAKMAIIANGSIGYS